MKSKLRLLLGFVYLVSLTFLPSCDGDPDPTPPPGEKGFYIVNEGAFGNNNASLSFYDRETGQVINDVFKDTNGRPLGDQAQSMIVFEGRGYIVVQNSGKVEVIDIEDNSSIKTITDGIESPRYFIGITAAKGYLSDWGADGLTGTVKVINLQTLAVAKTIPVGHGPNKMLKLGEKVYVANSGGFGYDNTLAVLDVTTDELITTTTVCDNPNSLQVDNAGNIWVACGGNLVYNQDFSINESASTKSALRKIQASVFMELPFPKFTYGTLGSLEISPNGQTLYYTFDGAVYSMATSAGQLPAQSLINKSYYGLSVDPFTGEIIGGLVTSFSSAGKIEVYGADGMLKESHAVGIAPNGCAFK